MNRTARLRSWFAEKLLQVVRDYFAGRTVHWKTSFNSQSIYRGEGKVICGAVQRDQNRVVTGMDLIWAQPGQGPAEFKRFPVTALSRDKDLGWVFHD